MAEPSRSIQRLIDVVFSVNVNLYPSEASLFKHALHHVTCGYEVCDYCRGDLLRLVAHEKLSPHLASIATDFIRHSNANANRR